MTEEAHTHINAMSQPPPSVPSPDPTALTTELVDRAIKARKEVVDVHLAALEKAIVIAHEYAVNKAASLRELLEAKINTVDSVGLEKFQGIDNRFLERDTRTQQAADESRISLDAALAAAKEAVSEQNKANAQAIAKSEVATQKQIDALVALMGTSNQSLEDKIADIKSRIDRGEGGSVGRKDYESLQRGIQDLQGWQRERGGAHAEMAGGRDQNNWIIGISIAVASVIVAISGVVIAVVTKV